ncbi:glycosyltransferase [Rubellicoccus peritrichatus]|uniref:Glycosyltransferase n=1 Tax=Rubellicoccus peritrichatus TaxID=3080537 RepID=A0AAQ3L751_9BACT|nr:glycosyltransferase [Puniceicoccus sp. CR14]WOO40814.1 glycosyltransferase [Puniceicoccus sp. CR14]
MVESDTNLGLSIIVCCHNSAKRLPETLTHLSHQDITEDWEVIVIDNASSDNTSEIAETFADRLPLRVVPEPLPGLSHARHRGFTESSFGVLGFIDDDNHVQADWARLLLNNFKERREIGACGGPIVEKCEVKPPEWFENFKGNYTIWAPLDTAGYMNSPLCGAGLGIRKQAIEQLLAKGFKSMLSDRKGANLSSGGDFELGYALLLTGWKLYYDPALMLEHFIPKERLVWDYLCRLNYGFGMQSVILDIYKALAGNSPMPNWSNEVSRTRLARWRQLPSHIITSLGGKEGSPGEILWQSQSGRLWALLQCKHDYSGMVETVRGLRKN